jgi:hypothetical protein
VLFVHFTSRPAAEAILASGQLSLSNVVVNAVFAVAVGGVAVPGVQHDYTGRRNVAVLFATDSAPDTLFPEEVIWHRTKPLPIRDAVLISATEADALLTGAPGIPDDGVHHPAGCPCPGCVCYRAGILGSSARMDISSVG